MQTISKKSKVLLILMISFSCAVLGQNNSIIQEGAALEKLSGDFSFTEGPASDDKGNVYFTDQPNNRIMLWTINNELITWMQPAGRSNGLCFDALGKLWACADEKNEMWVINDQKEVTILFDSYDGGKLNGPNDIWIAPDGSAFFSDPFYKRPWWDRENSEQDGQCVYFLSAGKKELIRIIDDLKQPNGIIGTPDGKMLYVTDIGDNKTWSYTIGKDGKLSGKTLFCEMGSDGMTIDDKGNIYLTNAKGVTVFNKTGEQIENIPINESWTANVCFGGSDMKSLFITAMSGLYRIRMNVKGVGSQ